MAEVGTCDTCHEPVDLTNENAVEHHTLPAFNAVCDQCWQCFDKPCCYRCFNADCGCNVH